MKTRPRTRTRALLVTVLSLVLLVLWVVPASAEGPTLTASLTPESANAGAETTFTLTVSPDSGVLASISLASPSGFFVGSASSSSGDATVEDDSTVDVTGLSITSDDTLTVTITAWPTCRPGTDNTWTLDGTQVEGETAYEQQTFSTNVTQPSSCTLVFQTFPDQLTNVAFTVNVDVVRANDTIDPTYTDTVSLSIENDPGSDDATLTGGGSTAASEGTATFSASLNRAGTGYVLEACSPAINGGPCAPALEDGLGFLSDPFAVYDSKKDCLNGQSCFTNAAIQGQASTQVTANGQNGTTVKAGAFGVPQAVVGGPGDPSNLDCGGYDEITEVITSFDFDGAGLKTVVDTVSAAQMKEVPTQGVSFLQACFGSSLPFTDRFGNPAVLDPTLGLYVGLLKDCPSNKKNLANAAPCILSRQGGGGGTGKLTYVAQEGDPGGARH